MLRWDVRATRPVRRATAAKSLKLKAAMPPEIVVIIIFSILAGVTAMITITKIIVNHLDRRRDSPASSSLTQGELRELIASAVAEATAPIETELSRLQNRLGAAESTHQLTAPEDTGDTDS